MLQVWDPVTGKLKKDLTYQAEEMFMMHEEAVLALAFNRESSVLVSGETRPLPPHQACCAAASPGLLCLFEDCLTCHIAPVVLAHSPFSCSRCCFIRPA